MSKPFRFFQDDNGVDLTPELGKIEFKEICTLGKPIRLYCISDIHADTGNNLQWVNNNCKPSSSCAEGKDHFNVLILPGDIAVDVDQLEQVFEIVGSRYDMVSYTPGNHEAWCHRGESNSLEKLRAVLDCARRWNIMVGPTRLFCDYSSPGVVVFPLFAWYHSSWDTEPMITDYKYQAACEANPFIRRWGDYNYCKWPERIIAHENFATVMNDVTTLAESFGKLNERYLYPIDSQSTTGFGSPCAQNEDFIVSYSHYLPRQELCPEKRFLLEPLLARVIGSEPLAEQVRRLRPHIHLFGHTHIPMDITLDGTRFIQWPLGYAREADKQCQPIHCSGPLLLFDSLCVPADLASFDTTWSQYNRQNKRAPEVTSPLSPWLEVRVFAAVSIVQLLIPWPGTTTALQIRGPTGDV